MIQFAKHKAFHRNVFELGYEMGKGGVSAITQVCGTQNVLYK
jgi:hypothetical protein